jgi:transposase
MSRTRAQYVRPLTDAERRVLQDSLRSSEAFVARRAQIVLASAAGERSEQIAPCVGGTTHGVRAVIRAFNARGLDALRPGSHHPDVVSTVDAPQSEAPRDLLHQSPHLCDTGGTASNVWTLERAAVAQEQGVTAEGGSDVTIRTTLAQMDVRWPQTREWTTSPDREYARNKARCTSLIRLAQRHPDWLLGCAEEVWWSGVSHPALHTWQDDGKAWRTTAPTAAGPSPKSVLRSPACAPSSGTPCCRLEQRASSLYWSACWPIPCSCYGGGRICPIVH